jgi:hypothetical protein
MIIGFFPFPQENRRYDFGREHGNWHTQNDRRDRKHEDEKAYQH